MSVSASASISLRTGSICSTRAPARGCVDRRGNALIPCSSRLPQLTERRCDKASTEYDADDCHDQAVSQSAITSRSCEMIDPLVGVYEPLNTAVPMVNASAP